MNASVGLQETSTAARAMVGKVIAGRFRLDGVLRDGSSGTFYQATQTSIDRQVEVKLLSKRHITGVDSTERFLQEARIVSGLTHPNIVRLIDFGSDDDHDVLFLVMESLQGLTLRELLEGHRLQPALVLELLYQMGGALTEPHELQVIHRDLKPENIFLMPRTDGGVGLKIMDFGVARALEQDHRVTTNGALFGTPAYMSPEQAQEGSVDARSDLYSLGIVAHEMLTGRPPFEAPTMIKLIFKHVQEEPPTICETLGDSELHEALDAILAKMLAKDPQARFVNALELREAIDDVRDDHPMKRVRVSKKGELLERFERWLISLEDEEEALKPTLLMTLPTSEPETTPEPVPEAVEEATLEESSGWTDLGGQVQTLIDDSAPEEEEAKVEEMTRETVSLGSNILSGSPATLRLSPLTQEPLLDPKKTVVSLAAPTRDPEEGGVLETPVDAPEDEVVEAQAPEPEAPTPAMEEPEVGATRPMQIALPEEKTSRRPKSAKKTLMGISPMKLELKKSPEEILGVRTTEEAAPQPFVEEPEVSPAKKEENAGAPTKVFAPPPAAAARPPKKTTNPMHKIAAAGISGSSQTDEVGEQGPSASSEPESSGVSGVSGTSATSTKDSPLPVNITAQFSSPPTPTQELRVDPGPTKQADIVQSPDAKLRNVQQLDSEAVQQAIEDNNKKKASMEAAQLDEAFFDSPLEPSFDADHIFVDDAYPETSSGRSIIIPVIVVVMLLLGGGVYGLVNSDIGTDEAAGADKAAAATTRSESSTPTTPTPDPEPATPKVEEAPSPVEDPSKVEEPPKVESPEAASPEASTVKASAPEPRKKRSRRRSRKKRPKKPAKFSPPTDSKKTDLALPPKKVGGSKVNPRLKKNLDWLKKR